jgi:predicted AAA+ superfamily ATPase
MPAVALLGPRQVGKTTLAYTIAEGRKSVYLDLESHLDREKLADAAFYLSGHVDDLVVLDEVQRVPELFATLRRVIDQGRRRGKKSGRFLLLGSASADLLRQSETLAGRIAYIELSPFDVLEVGAGIRRRLWVRGGLPESFLADDDSRSLIWRQDFIRTYLERDIPQLGPRIPAATLQVDLLLEIPKHGLWAIEIKRGLSARPEKGFFNACDDLKPPRRFLVNSGTERYRVDARTEAIGLRELAETLAAL